MNQLLDEAAACVNQIVVNLIEWARLCVAEVGPSQALADMTACMTQKGISTLLPAIPNPGAAVLAQALIKLAERDAFDDDDPRGWQG